MKHSWFDPHMVRAWKSMARALYIALGVFVAAFVLTHVAGALYVSHIAARATAALHDGIAHDLTHLKEQGDGIARDPRFQDLLLSQDVAGLNDFLQVEKNKRDIGLMGVADSRGVIITRTRSTGVVGDNAFLTSPVARVVAQGKSAESVEAPVGFARNQIFLNTGRPVMRGTEMIGALFANYLTDDTYAMRFQSSYLPRDVKVVFYNNEGGVYGNGFTDAETRRLIGSYFSPGSTWFQDGDSDKTLSFQDGTFYLVKNIVFPGLEGSPGGALLFIPRQDFSLVAQVATAVLMLVVFMVVVLRHHLAARGEERGWRYGVLLGVVSVLFVGLVWVSLRVERTSYLKLQHLTNPLYNSTLRVQPDFGIYDLSAERRFSVIVDTGDESINAVQVTMRTDPTMVDLKSFAVASSTCSYVVENTINATSGVATLSCVMIDRQKRQGSLTLGELVLQPKKAGSFTLTFDTDRTKVLADDGLGTDVLRMAQSGSYRVDAFDPALFTTSTVSSTSSRSFVVFSPTHPNASKWYHEDRARFVWVGRPGATYKYAFDTTPDTVPSDSRTLQGTSAIIPIPGDGVFYFHLQLVSGGPVAHYRIQSDRTPPTLSAIHLSSDTVTAGDVVRVTLDSEDAGSGLQKNYYVDFGSHLFLPAGPQLFVPFLTAGNHKILLRVYDNAGNYTERARVVRVQSGY